MEERRVLTGNPVSKGVAKAEAYQYEPLMLNVEAGYFKAGKETEYWRTFIAAQSAAKGELQQLQELVSSGDENAARIFGAHIAILEDEDLQYELRNAILNDRMYPELAIEACFGELVKVWSNTTDTMLAERVADIYDVKHRLLRNYLGKIERCLSHLDRDVIVVAQDLLPSDVATIDRTHVRGIITEKDTTNSHAAVLAKSYGIPMITGVTGAIEALVDTRIIEMDGAVGTIRIETVT